MSTTSSRRSTKARTKPADVSPALSDADALRKLWRLTLDGSIKALESGEANASSLSVARAFLADNDTNIRHMPHLDPPAFDYSGLPSFDE